MKVGYFVCGGSLTVESLIWICEGIRVIYSKELDILLGKMYSTTRSMQPTT